MSIMSKLKEFNRIELAALAFYLASGVIFLVYLPLLGFPPQLGLLGILSLIAAYGVFTKRWWTPWALVILFISATTFSLYTLIVIGFSNAPVASSMIVYAVLTWILTGYMLLKKTPLTR